MNELNLIYQYLATFPGDKGLTMAQLAAKVQAHQSQLDARPEPAPPSNRTALIRERQEWRDVKNSTGGDQESPRVIRHKKRAAARIKELDKLIA